MRLTDVNLEDEGFYTCVVSNEFGQLNWTRKLDVMSQSCFVTFCCCVFRPPGTISSGRAYVLPVIYLSFFRHAFSELPRPIALKLCHMIGIWL